MRNSQTRTGAGLFSRIRTTHPVPGSVRGALRDAADAVLDLVYPPGCALCSEEIEGRRSPRLCSACRDALRPSPAQECRRCAATVGPYQDTARGCLRCRGRSLKFDGVMRLGVYSDRLREACLLIKRRRYSPLAAALAEMLWNEQHGRLREARADVVVPVPLHWLRRVQRGLNPTEAVARALAVRLQRPCSCRMLKRQHNTLPQASLPPSRRWENVRGAFRVRGRNQEGLSILLVDDVLTTGATASEAARALKAAGAKRVWVAVIARGEGAQ